MAAQLTDDEKRSRLLEIQERAAIQVEHLPDDEADREYRRLVDKAIKEIRNEEISNRTKRT